MSQAYEIAHLLAGVMLVTSFALLYQERVAAVLNAFAAQSITLALAVAWAAWSDNRPDLFITAVGGNHLFHNEEKPDGGRHFVEVTQQAGVGGPGGWPTPKDGDFLSHDERYARTDEYVEILRRIWTADKPVDHEGKYYKFTRASSDIKSLQKPHIPIYFGGASDAAIAIAGKHADVYALWGEPLANAAKTIAQVRASAAAHGRTVRFSLSRSSPRPNRVTSMELGSRPASRAISRNFGRASAISPRPATGIQPSP